MKPVVIELDAYTARVFAYGVRGAMGMDVDARSAATDEVREAVKDALAEEDRRREYVRMLKTIVAKLSGVPRELLP